MKNIPTDEGNMSVKIKNFITFDIKRITNEYTPPRPRIKFGPSIGNSGCKTLTSKNP